MANIFSKTPYQVQPKEDPFISSKGSNPTTPSITSAPSSTAPALTTPAAQTYMQNQTTQTPAPIDNSTQINSIKGQIGDLQSQKDALGQYGFSDTNQLEQGTDGKYKPSPYENAKADYTKAYEDYIQTLNPSKEVSDAETAYNDYTANQAKSIAGLSGQGRGIPLTLVRGQQARLLGQTQPEAQRLQNAIGIAENRDTNRRNAGLAGVSLAEKKLGMQQSPTDIEKADQATLKSNADLAKTKADTAKTEGETSMIGKMTDFQKAQLVQDESQFGRTYALAQLKAAQDSVNSPNSPQAQLAKDTEATSGMNLINTLLQNPNVGAITGALQGLLPGVLDRRGDTQLALNQFNQIKGMLALENRSKLKGQGAVSDFEGKVLDRAASSLGTNLKDKDFIEQLKQIRGSIATSHGLTADVLLTDPKTGKSQVVNSDSSGIAQAVKDGLVVSYQ